MINVFTCSISNYLGWAYLPWQYSEGSKYQALVINHDTFPGGDFVGINEGLQNTITLERLLVNQHPLIHGMLASISS